MSGVASEMEERRIRRWKLRARPDREISRKYLPEKNFLPSSPRTILELPIHGAGSEVDAVNWWARDSLTRTCNAANREWRIRRRWDATSRCNGNILGRNFFEEASFIYIKRLLRISLTEMCIFFFCESISFRSFLLYNNIRTDRYFWWTSRWELISWSFSVIRIWPSRKFREN